MNHVELTTARLTLRPPSEADIPRVAEICSDAAVTEFTTVPYPYDVGHARTFIVDVIPAGWVSGSTLTWGIYTRSDARLLGVVSLSRISDGMAELGYWLDPLVRRQGLMTEAAARVVEFALRGATHRTRPTSTRMGSDLSQCRIGPSGAEAWIRLGRAAAERCRAPRSTIRSQARSAAQR